MGKHCMNRGNEVMPGVSLTNYIVLDEPDGPLPEIGSVTYPGRAESPKGPKGRQVWLYGARAILPWLSKASQAARKNGKAFYRIDASADAGTVGMDKVHLDNLADAKVIAPTRLTVAVRQAMVDILGRKNLDQKDVFDVISRNPEVLNTLWGHELFAHINVFIWETTHEGEAVKLAAVRSPEIITEAFVRNYYGPDTKPRFKAA